jgi:hypothetical protein
MRYFSYFIGPLIVSFLAGCAGNVKAPLTYSPEETRSGGAGTTIIPKGSTGEISYCDAGMAFQVKSRRNEACTAISAASRHKHPPDRKSGGLFYPAHHPHGKLIQDRVRVRVRDRDREQGAGSREQGAGSRSVCSNCLSPPIGSLRCWQT